MIGTMVPGSTSVRCCIRFTVEMAKAPTTRMVWNAPTLNTVYLESVGQVATNGVYTSSSSGLNNVNLAANPNATVFADVLGDWDAATGW